MNWRSFLQMGLVVAVVLSVPALALACPTCKDGMENDPAAAAMIQGYFWSILFMMSMPFLIFSGLATYFYLEVRKARRDGRLPPAGASATS